MTLFVALRALYDVCLIVTTMIGLSFGARSERVGVAILLVATLATAMVQRMMMFDWLHHRTGLIAVDVCVLLAFFHLTLTSRRFWPLWATAFHLIAVCSHCVVLLEPSRIVQVYAFFQGFWAYPIMFLIIVAALSRFRRHAAMRTSTAIGRSSPRSISWRMRYTE